MSKTLEIKILTQLQDKLSAPLNKLCDSAGKTDKKFQELKGRISSMSKLQRNIEQFKSLETGLTKTSARLDIARDKLHQLETQFGATVNPSKSLTAQLSLARLNVDRLKDAYSQQNAKLTDMTAKLSNAGISTKNLASHEVDLANKIKVANEAFAKQQDAINKVVEKQKKLAAAKDTMAKTQQLASNMAVTGAAGYMGGKKVLTGMASIMQPGVGFDSSMSKVQALTRLDKDSKEFEMLRQQARDLGASTMFSATEAADAQGFLAMAGFTPDAIQKAMPGMLDLAKAGGTDLAMTADISSNILSGMKLDPSEMARVGDVLTGAFTRSNTNLEMLGETMKYAAPMAASLNVDIETLAAATGKLGDAGIQGSNAGTALRSILNRLSAPPKAAAKALNALNIKTTDAKGNLKDFPTILEELDRKTKKMGNAKRAEYFKAIAGEEAVSSLNVLVDKAATGELQGFVKTLKNAGGEATKVAKTMSDNIIGDLDELSSAWEDVGISIFDGQKGFLRGLVQDVTKVVNVIGAWIRANPELTATIMKVVAIIAAVVAAMGGLSIALASVIGPFAIMRYAMSFLSINGFGLIGVLGKLGGALGIVKTVVLGLGRALLMNPIGIAVMAIGTAAYFIWQNWDLVKAKTLEIWNSIKTTVSEAIAAVSHFIQQWNPVNYFTQAFSNVSGYFPGLKTNFTEFGSNLMSGLVDGIKNMAGQAYEAISEVGSGVVGWFKKKLDINSPSRVFMNMGGFVSEGLSEGIANTSGLPVKAMKNMAMAVTAAGALSPVVSAAAPIKFDQRPAMSARAISATASPAMGGDVFNITINTTSSQSAQDIARIVQQEIERVQAQKRVRQRSSYTDYGY